MGCFSVPKVSRPFRFFPSLAALTHLLSSSLISCFRLSTQAVQFEGTWSVFLLRRVVLRTLKPLLNSPLLFFIQSLAVTFKVSSYSYSRSLSLPFELISASCLHRGDLQCKWENDGSSWRGSSTSESLLLDSTRLDSKLTSSFCLRRTLEIKRQAKEAEEKRKEAEEQRRQQELLVDVTSHGERCFSLDSLRRVQGDAENLSTPVPFPYRDPKSCLSYHTELRSLQGQLDGCVRSRFFLSRRVRVAVRRSRLLGLQARLFELRLLIQTFNFFLPSQSFTHFSRELSRTERDSSRPQLSSESLLRIWSRWIRSLRWPSLRRS